MRALLALSVVLGLAGCAPEPPPPLSAAAAAAALDPGFSDRRGAPAATGPDPRFIPAARTPADLAARRQAEDAAGARLMQAERDAQASAICAARAEMASATYPGRGFGMSGAILTGVEAGIAAERVRAACLEAYRVTGVLPTF